MSGVLKCDENGAEHYFDDLLIIGRGEDVKINLKDMVVSRKHCAIFECWRDYYLVDLGSRNGTIYYSGDYIRKMPNVLESSRFGNQFERGKDFIVFYNTYIDNRTGREFLVAEGNSVQKLKNLDRIGIPINNENQTCIFEFLR